MHDSLKIIVGAIHREDNSLAGFVQRSTELLICMPWALPGGYTKSGNTSAWECRIHLCPMPPHCTISCSSVVFPKLLSNISIPFFSFLITPQGKAFTSSCTPAVPSVFFDVTDSQRQPTSQLRAAHVSWLPSRLSAEPLLIFFHQEGMALISRNQTLLHIFNSQV